MSLITAFQPTRDPRAEIVRGSRQEIYEDSPITVMQNYRRISKVNPDVKRESDAKAEYDGSDWRQQLHTTFDLTDSQIDAMPATAAASLVVTSMFADKAEQTTNVDDKNRCVAGGLAFAL